jgi:hypothetical protein
VLGIHRLLIIYCDYGRLGNRLHTHVNALAWCIENNYNLINLSFNEYAPLFKNSSKHKSGNLQQTNNFLFKSLSSSLFRNILRRLLLSDKWLERLAWIVKQIRPTDDEVLRETDLNRQINQKKINLVKHWDVSCFNSLQTHQNKIRHYLLPNKIFVTSTEKIIDDLRSKYECIVGVHARRGDYISYLDGIHYHSWESYLYWANQTKHVLEKSGKKNVGIVICSDELPPASIPQKKSIYFSLGKEFMVDIHLLSLCNYNLGPPSSFGTWVSWFGKLPRLVVHKNTEITSLEQFEVCATC